MSSIKTGLLALSVLTALAQLQGCDKAPDAQAEAAASAASAASAAAMGTQAASGAVVITKAEPESLPANASSVPVVGEGGNAVAVVREVKGGLKVGGQGPVVEFYPGAVEDVARGNKQPIPGGNMVVVLLNTRDPLEKVAAFYRQQLKANWPAKGISEQSSDPNTAIMSASSLEGDKTVMISVARSEDDGKGTAISILTATKVLDASGH
ncbi:MAG: hypothetical protein RJB60_524 [Pseudomonadota bacterium]|jgi:hypothetical protein